MIELTPQLTAMLAERLQIGSARPTVRLEFDRLDDAGRILERVSLEAVSCEVDSRLDVDADGLTASFPLIAPGRHLAPDWIRSKFPDPEADSIRWAPQEDQRYQGLLTPETPVRVYLGYGDQLVQVFTGSIDRIQIDAAGDGEWTVGIQARNNFKQALEARLLQPLTYMNTTVSTIISDLARRAGLTEQIIEETVMPGEQDGEYVPYQVSYVLFEEGRTIAECIREMADLVDMRAWADARGRFRLARLRVDEDTPIAHEIHGERNLLTMSYTLDGSLFRNHLIIVGQGGETSEFQSEYITRLLKGKTRSAKTTAPWLDSHWKRRLAAQGLFRRMGQLARTMTTVIPLHPGIEVGDCIRLHDVASTAAGVYQVVGLRHTVNAGGALTQVDLSFVTM